MTCAKQSELLCGTACAVMLAAFAVLAYTAVRQKSATADEPLHALSGYMVSFHRDYRLNSEDPPLWKYWAMLPHLAQGADTVRADRDSELWRSLPQYIWNGTKYVTQTLYRTPGNDPDVFIGRSRVMMLLIGVGLAALVTVWAWRLGGPIAGVIACALYSLDPNLLGHAPLVKDDVVLAMTLAGMTWATWRAGLKLTVGRAILVALWLAIGLNVKFSGVLMVPFLCAMLIGRVVVGGPWVVLGRQLGTWRARAAAAMGMLALCAVVSVAGIWASYGFRFRPTRDPGIRLNMPLIAQSVTWTDLVARDPQHRPPRPDTLAAAQPKLAVRVALWINDHELLPQAWLSGFLDTYKTTMLGQSYLCGRINRTGVWYYFPATMLFKTPTATLAAIGIATGIGIIGLRRRRSATAGADRWSLLCLWVPLVLYSAFAVTSGMNLGLRHILAIYPVILVLAATTLARVVHVKAFRIVLAVLAVGLAVESVAAYPNYIAFFNTPSGGSRGGIRFLGDSNLDWGQDLRLLAAWRGANPDARLFVSYFGMADAGYYLGSYTALPGNSSSPLSHQLPRPGDQGVLAISATNLQGIYLDEQARDRYRRLWAHNRPIDVLGGTIYLYELNDQVRRNLGVGGGRE